MKAKRTPQQIGRSSKRKGKVFERLMSQEMREVYAGAKRGIGQARSAKEVADVDGTPWWVECKHGKQVSIAAAIRQATAATDGRPLLVLSRNDGEPVLATMLWQDLKALLLMLRSHHEQMLSSIDRELDKDAKHLLDEVKGRGTA